MSFLESQPAFTDAVERKKIIFLIVTWEVKEGKEKERSKERSGVINQAVVANHFRSA